MPTRYPILILKPEKSTTFELGAKTDPDNLSLSATGYYRIGRDIIDWVKFPDSEVWESSNWTAINAYGMDLSIIYRPDKLFIRSISTNYSFLGMNKETEGIDSKYALDYQKTQG